MVYDTQTRSERKPVNRRQVKINQRDDFIENEDGSVDLYFGPTAPKGKEAN